ncbi:MAG TPA: Asp-tRNA(Asn)/Glu-tRNA(Gln) amidotransferase GatCAB subunit B [Clostridiaceae bacterium]|nr:Asp-tRNA(Asn)/Glu-tRNA(Gln) amidotransferase GatCAB subunit B [Clostridiaceae bacterium]
MNYETIIGLEVHAELSTKTKIYCGCTSEFGGQPNTHCCPVCLGLPGSLPKINKKAVEYAVKAGLALNCSITRASRMARKNYFYPDCPKDYQITQQDFPLCANGFIEIETKNGPKKIGIERIHIEEDAGKLLHVRDGSLVDYNRAGVPLIEVVSKPDMRSPEEARLYLEKLKSILWYIGVSDCKMEEGSLRCDANISIRPEGEDKFGTKTEIKNMNSFKALEKALGYERTRQKELLDGGGTVHQDTRRWDDSKEMTFVMRSKEHAHDYRYFPEPDLTPIEISDEWLEEIRSRQPELRDEKMLRYEKEFDIPAYDAGIITGDKKLADLFEETTAICGKPKEVSNWLMVETMRLLKEQEMEAEEIAFTPAQLAALIDMVDSGKVNRTVAKEVFEHVFRENADPQEYVEKHGLGMISDDGLLRTVIRRVIGANLQSVADYKSGKTKAMGFIVGQTMKEMKGKADPGMINQIVREMLDQL